MAYVNDPLKGTITFWGPVPLLYPVRFHRAYDAGITTKTFRLTMYCPMILFKGQELF
jgi:hypothetical protein